MKYHTSLGYSDCVVVTEVHTSIKYSKSLDQYPKDTFYDLSCSAVSVVVYSLIFR